MEEQSGRSPKMRVWWRCEFCTPKQSDIADVDGEDPPASACYRAVIEAHNERSPDCPNTHNGRFTNAVAVDFLVRLVQ